jgi:hypothetical protein
MALLERALALAKRSHGSKRRAVPLRNPNARASAYRPKNEARRTATELAEAEQPIDGDRFSSIVRLKVVGFFWRNGRWLWPTPYSTPPLSPAGARRVSPRSELRPRLWATSRRSQVLPCYSRYLSLFG